MHFNTNKIDILANTFLAKTGTIHQCHISDALSLNDSHKIWFIIQQMKFGG